MFKTETNLIVRYAETDQMGIVHHSNYPIWFEAARTDFVKTIGMPYSEIEKQGLMLPLIELSCRYKGSARYEDEIIVRTNIKNITYTRIVFYYDVYLKNDSKIINTGETTHVFTDRNLKPVNLKKHAPYIYQLLFNAVKEGEG